MNLYSKLEKHLPREKECVPEEYADLIINENTGFNQCKAQYDEVLRRVVVDEEKLKAILNEYYPLKDDVNIWAAQAIANSPDVIRVKD